MIPGNRDPRRYAGRATLSVAVAALIAAGASSTDILDQFLEEREGSRQVAYLDGGSTTQKRIWTICKGLTKIDGKPVTEGMRLSKSECAEHDRKELQATLAEMERLVMPNVWAGLSEPAKAGIASFCTYNLGATRCKGTTFLRLLNEGRRNEACAEITKWIMDQGKDCRIRVNGCFGQVDRRQQEDQLCLS